MLPQDHTAGHRSHNDLPTAPTVLETGSGRELVGRTSRFCCISLWFCEFDSAPVCVCACVHFFRRTPWGKKIGQTMMYASRGGVQALKCAGAGRSARERVQARVKHGASCALELRFFMEEKEKCSPVSKYAPFSLRYEVNPENFDVATFLPQTHASSQSINTAIRLSFIDKTPISAYGRGRSRRPPRINVLSASVDVTPILTCLSPCTVVCFSVFFSSYRSDLRGHRVH